MLLVNSNIEARRASGEGCDIRLIPQPPRGHFRREVPARMGRMTPPAGLEDVRRSSEVAPASAGTHEQT
jgi:hypothetical protein